MTRQEKISQQCLQEKAAMMQSCKPGQIKKVTENYNGAYVEYKNGDGRIIPLEYWIGEKVWND